MGGLAGTTSSRPVIAGSSVTVPVVPTENVRSVTPEIELKDESVRREDDDGACPKEPPQHRVPLPSISRGHQTRSNLVLRRIL